MRPGSSSRRHTSRVRALPQDDKAPNIGGPCPVPEDQQPIRELEWLREEALFAWATLPLPQFVARLAGVYGLFLITLGLPVSAVTFDTRTQSLECFVAASIGSMLIVMVTLARLYLGWAHVGNRLLSATVEYEETGWYDGQVWVKSQEVLARDRLLGTYTVKPTLARLQSTMVSCAGVMASAAILLAALPPPEAQGLAAAVPAPGAAEVDLSYERAWSQRNVEEADYWKAVQCFEPWALDDARAAGSDTGDIIRSLGPGGHFEGCKMERDGSATLIK